MPWIQGSNFADSINPGFSTGYAPMGTVEGMGGNDTLVAGYYTRTIDGGTGDDTVSSSDSSVNFTGGNGDDLLISGVAGDIFEGGPGTDTVDYSGYANGVTVTSPFPPGFRSGQAAIACGRWKMSSAPRLPTRFRATAPITASPAAMATTCSMGTAAPIRWWGAPATMC